MPLTTQSLSSHSLATLLLNTVVEDLLQKVPGTGYARSSPSRVHKTVKGVKTAWLKHEHDRNNLQSLDCADEQLRSLAGGIGNNKCESLNRGHADLTTIRQKRCVDINERGMV